MVSNAILNKIHPAAFEQMVYPKAQVVPVILTIKPDKFNDVLSMSMSKFGFQVRQQMPTFSMASILLRPTDIPLIASLDAVTYVDADIVKNALSVQQQAQAAVAQNYIPTSQSRTIIGADKAEAEGFNGAGVLVAILDTGVFNFHQQLMLKANDINAMLPALPKMPMLPQLPEPPLGVDDNGHGTHVITTIGGNQATAPNGLVCKGMAPGAKLLSIKVLGTPLGTGQSSDVLKGMELAITKGAQVISMSLGSDGGDNTYPEARIVNAHPEIIWCIAAGNSGPGAKTIGTPGCAINALSVGSYGVTDKGVSWFSSRGPTNDNFVKPDVIAPGGGRVVEPDKTTGAVDENIYSGSSPGTVMDIIEDKDADGYAALMGTSMATPHVSGLIALAIQAGLVKTGDNVKAKMAASMPAGFVKDNNQGYGIITWDRLKTVIKA